MRKLKLRKRISNFPKATQLVSDRSEIKSECKDTIKL